jgi:hypothetical protein
MDASADAGIGDTEVLYEKRPTNQSTGDTRPNDRWKTVFPHEAVVHDSTHVAKPCLCRPSRGIADRNCRTLNAR